MTLARVRRGQVLLVVEHGAFALLLLTGGLMAWHRGWWLGSSRWFGVKLGLVFLLLLPLEAFHAYVCHRFIARGLRETPAPPFSQELARGLAVQEMIRSLGVPLLGMAVPLLFWLSMRRPF